MGDIEALDGVDIDDSVVRIGELSPGSYTEQTHFKLYLEQRGRRSDRPIFHGLSSAGRASQHIPGWIDGFYGGVAVFDADTLELSAAGLDGQLFRRIGEVIAPGGWLGLAYETLGEDTALLRETRRLLNLGVPAVVTPLGFLLHHAGCGLNIRNWYISEGWREGPRKLQGFKPTHAESRHIRARETAEELERFLAAADRSEELRAIGVRARGILETL